MTEKESRKGTSDRETPFASMRPLLYVFWLSTRLMNCLASAAG